MQGDLISRKDLIEKFNYTGIQITFDLPVEEVLGEDVDIDDFAMLVQDAIQSYKKMVIGVIQEQPPAYSVEKVIEQIESEKEATYNRCIKGMYDAMFKDFIGIVSNGGKE